MDPRSTLPLGRPAGSRMAGREDDLDEQVRLARAELRNAEVEMVEASENVRYRERELDRLLEEAEPPERFGASDLGDPWLWRHRLAVDVTGRAEGLDARSTIREVLDALQ